MKVIFNSSVFALFLMTASSALNSQVINNIKEPELTQYSLAEKIYIQLDNSFYQTGETVWFKTIVVTAYNNTPSSISKILNVDLINSNDEIVESKLLKLENGMAYNSFVLQKGFQSGTYRIRAYTQWNRNFNDNFIVYSPFEVVNTSDKNNEVNPFKDFRIDIGEETNLKGVVDVGSTNYSTKDKLQLIIETENKTDTLNLSEHKDLMFDVNYSLNNSVNSIKLKLRKEGEKIFDEVSFSNYDKTIVVDPNYLDLSFFPEGGKLVSGVLSTVGFKATNYKGLGEEVLGEIIDNQQNLVSVFKSNTLGMGTFKIMPKQGISYRAELVKDGVIYSYKLPKIELNGTVLSVVNHKNELKINLQSNVKNSKFFKVEISSGGIKYQSYYFNYQEKILLSVPDSSLKDGINKISVLNDKNQIQCERLVFHNNLDNRVTIQANTNRKNYNQREKVKLSLVLDSLSSSGKASLSVLVLNNNRLEAGKLHQPHIVSYLLLNSELKGFVEQPNHYFNPKNEQRLLDLDALMLTQGWRNYIYQNEKPITSFAFQPETHLELSGTIGEYFNPKKRPKDPLDINLMVHNDIPLIYNAEIASTGKYSFLLDDIYKNSSEYFMQVVDKKGKPVDLKINVNKKWLPAIEPNKISLEIPIEIQQSFIKETEETNAIIKDFEETYGNTVALREVNIKGYKLTPKRKEFIEKHGEPTKIINGKDLVKRAPKWNYGVLSVIRAEFPDKVEIKEVGPPENRFLVPMVKGTEYDDSFTYVIIDNIPVVIRDYSLIQSLPVEEVESIDILESPKNKNKYCDEVFKAIKCPNKVALVNIYTKSGKGIYGMDRIEGAKTDVIKGFSQNVEFYAPKYDILTAQDWALPDSRSVIHWSPDITLNSTNNQFDLEFYNDDYTGEVSVIIEAISEDGSIGYTKLNYNIIEAEK